MMKRYILIAILVLAFPALALAQSVTDIHGRVTDQRNATVAGAQVSLLSRSGAQFVALTDSNGEYRFKGLPGGDYVIEVQAKGFATFTSKALYLERSQSLAKRHRAARSAHRQADGTGLATAAILSRFRED